MATSKPITRYTPTPVPFAASPALRVWLGDELDFASLAINALIDGLEAPAQFLYGDADSVLVSPTPALIQNYEFSDARGVASVPDRALGEITVPQSGLYNGVAYVYGLQGDPDKDEEIHLLMQVNSDPLFTIASLDVSTRKTDDRALNAALTFNLVAGDVLSLYINATDDIGIFNMLRTTLHIIRIK